jgi:shikimate kinase
MGSGKSTVGPVLAKRLGSDFIDLDSQIEFREGKPISEIFQSRGQAYFREIETQILRELSLSPKSHVIALGGGSLILPHNQACVKATGMLIYLQLEVLNLVQRLQKDHARRPLLAGLNSEEICLKVFSLFQERKSSYESADFQISCDHFETDEIVKKILQALSPLNPKVPYAESVLSS